MALKSLHKEIEFGVGDKVRVVQKIKDGDKVRESVFEGMVIGIKGRDVSKTFMVRKIAEGGIGVERIFPLSLPSIDRVVVVKRGVEGVKRAKLYYTRAKSPTEIEMIYKRASKVGKKVIKRVSMRGAAKPKTKRVRKSG